MQSHNTSNDGSEPQENMSSLNGIKLSQEQMNRLMSLVNAVNIKESDTTNIAGITCLTSISINKGNWIIDSGATEHITPHIEML